MFWLKDSLNKPRFDVTYLIFVGDPCVHRTALLFATGVIVEHVLGGFTPDYSGC